MIPNIDPTLFQIKDLISSDFNVNLEDEFAKDSNLEKLLNENADANKKGISAENLRQLMLTNLQESGHGSCSVAGVTHASTF
jgi:hypothetical protein